MGVCASSRRMEAKGARLGGTGSDPFTSSKILSISSSVYARPSAAAPVPAPPPPSALAIACGVWARARDAHGAGAGEGGHGCGAGVAWSGRWGRGCVCGGGRWGGGDGRRGVCDEGGQQCGGRIAESRAMRRMAAAEGGRGRAVGWGARDACCGGAWGGAGAVGVRASMRADAATWPRATARRAGRGACGGGCGADAPLGVQGGRRAVCARMVWSVICGVMARLRGRGGKAHRGRWTGLGGGGGTDRGVMRRGAGERWGGRPHHSLRLGLYKKQ